MFQANRWTDEVDKDEIKTVEYDCLLSISDTARFVSIYPNKSACMNISRSGYVNTAHDEYMRVRTAYYTAQLFSVK